MDQSKRENKQLEYTFPFLTWNNADLNFPPHWHACFEIIYMRRGHIYASVDDTVYKAEAGDLVMVNAGTVHGYFGQSPNVFFQGFQFGSAFFGDDFIPLRDIIFNVPVLSTKNMPDILSLRLRTLLDEIASEYNRKQIGWQLAVKSMLYELMLMILREQSKIIPHETIRAMSSGAGRMLSFVFKNYSDESLSLEDAANALKLNKYYFSRFFKKHIGQSFHAYLTKTRVEFAKRYLIESKMTVTDIVFHSGFNSIQTFNRVFRALTGLSPREYRRKNSVAPQAGFAESFIASKTTKNINY
ncbi:MAG: AraC family transcriptional regulator [Spirochaetaceae bacterium]|jgi:AraC-like DNA-binding protein|nr:AraC family transcriptional regulator [Spirochaetaceae bacterium]